MKIGFNCQNHKINLEELKQQISKNGRNRARQKKGKVHKNKPKLTYCQPLLVMVPKNFPRKKFPKKISHVRGATFKNVAEYFIL